MNAIVIGSGPNGLAAAVELARHGASVDVLEAEDTIGGGARTLELTLPGFLHDICSAVHPMAAASPVFDSWPLNEYGLTYIHSPAWLAHPLDDGTAVTGERRVASTAEQLGRDAATYERLMDITVPTLRRLLTGRGFGRLPNRPLRAAKAALTAAGAADAELNAMFKEERGRAFLAGISAHSNLALSARPTMGLGLLLATLGHLIGWPIVAGGSQGITKALAHYLDDLGGQVTTREQVNDLSQLPPANALLLDLTPIQIADVGRSTLPRRYRTRLRTFRYGAGVYKIDWALAAPIPWKAAQCQRSATVHLGGTLDEIEASEAAVARGKHPAHPFVLLTQPSLFDAARAPAGSHTAWAYCHVPGGSDADMARKIEAQVERFAPGFNDIILARNTYTADDMAHHNANLVGGDISGGAVDLRQLVRRPALRFPPYSTPVKGIFVCSSSTPPGPGVHGLCGYLAARSAIRQIG